MSSTTEKKIATYRAGSGGVLKGNAVKLSSGLVVKGAAVTDRVIGIANNAADEGGAVEVCLPGGGGQGLAKTTIAEGDLLGVNADGSLQKVDGASSIIIAQAMEGASAGEIFEVNVIGPSQATAAQS